MFPIFSETFLAANQLSEFPIWIRIRVSISRKRIRVFILRPDPSFYFGYGSEFSSLKGSENLSQIRIRVSTYILYHGYGYKFFSGIRIRVYSISRNRIRDSISDTDQGFNLMVRIIVSISGTDSEFLSLTQSFFQGYMG